MGIQKVVVGMDFSTPAVEAARWVAQHFAPDAEIVLCHVVDLPRTPAFLRGVAPPSREIEPAARDFASERLEELATFITPGRARNVIRTGRPHDELARLAEETGADLVVVGPHGDRPRPFKLLGTTAERLARAATPAVLVANGLTVLASVPRRLLVAVDDADITTSVLAWARQLADQFEADITLLHALSNASMSHVMSLAAATARDEADRVAQISANLIDEGIRWLDALAETGLGSHRTEAVVTFGSAGDAVLRTAEEVGADLIVMGRRGSGAVLPAMLGSTVSTVLHGSRCPVLVVGEREDDSADRAPKE